MKKTLITLFVLLSLNIVLASSLEEITLTEDIQQYKVGVTDGLSIKGYGNSVIIVDNIGTKSVDLKVFGYDGTVLIYYTLGKDKIIKVDFDKNREYDAEIGFIKKSNEKAIIAVKGVNEEDPYNYNLKNTTTTTRIDNEEITGSFIEDLLDNPTKISPIKGIFITLIVMMGVIGFYSLFKKKE